MVSHTWTDLKERYWGRKMETFHPRHVRSASGPSGRDPNSL